jgi:hypothetical protein
MSASEKLKALDMKPIPYEGRKYRVLCARCNGHGEVNGTQADDPRWLPCSGCDGSGLKEPYRSYVRALSQIVAVVEASEAQAQAVPATGWNSSDRLRAALAALDEALS